MIDELLGSKAKVKILRFFFDFPFAKRNVREVAKECRIGFGVASFALKELEKMEIIKMEKVGKEFLYSLNTASKFFDPLKKLFEMEREMYANLPYIYRNLISDVITATKRIAESCFLFGSIVSGTFTTKSDVDLLFVSEREEELRKKCLRIEDKYNIKLQVIVIRRNEIEKFRKSSLYKTIKKEALVLFEKERII